jgi:hypothetical protein
MRAVRHPGLPPNSSTARAAIEASFLESETASFLVPILSFSGKKSRQDSIIYKIFRHLCVYQAGLSALVSMRGSPEAGKRADIIARLARSLRAQHLAYIIPKIGIYSAAGETVRQIVRRTIATA